MPRYTPVWLDYLEAKKNKLDVKDVLVHLVLGDLDRGHRSLRIFLCIHIFVFHFFAALMDGPRLRTSQVSPTQFH